MSSVVHSIALPLTSNLVPCLPTARRICSESFCVLPPNPFTSYRVSGLSPCSVLHFHLVESSYQGSFVKTNRDSNTGPTSTVLAHSGAFCNWLFHCCTVRGMPRNSA